ncbi:MAG: tRNA 2-thiocytidine(32) synthetase TtcA [Coxiella sp. (in: Bacteria)]|nr:MAG: tRNA 2-thiocytidine(32) synthetase TtcA [Coxiella sp. (in: g-proteobacteria)]
MSKPSKLEQKLIHYIGKALHDYKMLNKGDRLMVCLSGGKDSFTLLTLLNKMRIGSNYRFELFSYTLDQSHPGWDDSQLREWLDVRKIPYEIETRDTYSVVKEKVPEGKTYCSLCSRLRRGNIYRYAEDNGFNKIALGHHRDDLIQTLMMSILYNGQICSMPPKLLTDSKKQVVLRPMVYCQEKDIQAYAEEQKFPIIPCNLCGSQQNLKRQQVKRLIDDLEADNPNVPSNMLHALQSINPSQLMDHKLWNFDF